MNVVNIIQNEYCVHPFYFILFCIAISFLFIAGLMLLISIYYRQISIVASIVCFICIICIGIGYRGSQDKYTVTKYEIVCDDTVTVNQLLEKYEVVQIRGNIITVKDKE